METPKFGDWIRGIFASESNPQRDGMFVREKVNSGRLNPGKWWELTNGKGKFWSYPPTSCIAIPHAGAPITPEQIALRDAEWEKRYGKKP